MDPFPGINGVKAPFLVTPYLCTRSTKVEPAKRGESNLIGEILRFIFIATQDWANKNPLYEAQCVYLRLAISEEGGNAKIKEAFLVL